MQCEKDGSWWRTTIVHSITVYGTTQARYNCDVIINAMRGLLILKLVETRWRQLAITQHRVNDITNVSPIHIISAAYKIIFDLIFFSRH